MSGAEAKFFVHKNANKVQWIMKVCFDRGQMTLDCLMLELLSSSMNGSGTAHPAGTGDTPADKGTWALCEGE